MKILERFSPLVEQASVDEAYFDLSQTKDYSGAAAMAREIKRTIKEERNLTCSIGIGPNKLVAKIAAGSQKPDGLTVVEDKQVQAFLDKLDVNELPGVGPKTKENLKELGILSIRDLRRKMTLRNLETIFGKSGKNMYYKARGIDESKLSLEHEIKTVGASETFEKDTRDFNFISERISLMCEEILHRVSLDGFKKFFSIVLTVRFSDFETKDRSITLKEPISKQKDLEFEITKLLMPFFDKRENPKKKKIRLVGVRVKKLV
jgi:DNA polymerase IV (DinB-like DNA polymerase)